MPQVVEIVIAPVLPESETQPPCVSEVTPVFWMEKMLPLVAIEMPVEALRAIVPVRLPIDPTPVTEPVAPLNDVTPAPV